MASYLFGNILTAYIVTKWRHNVDIRDEGSGNRRKKHGARIWKRVFRCYILGDAIKGNRSFYCKIPFEDSTFVMLTLLAVIIGHIYPVLFKGKGGKGISTFIGGLIAFDYLIALT